MLSREIADTRNRSMGASREMRCTAVCSSSREGPSVQSGIQEFGACPALLMLLILARGRRYVVGCRRKQIILSRYSAARSIPGRRVATSVKLSRRHQNGESKPEPASYLARSRSLFRSPLKQKSPHPTQSRSTNLESARAQKLPGTTISNSPL